MLRFSGHVEACISEHRLSLLGSSSGREGGPGEAWGGCWCRAVGAATLMLVQAWGSGAGLVQQQLQAWGSSRSGAATGLVLLQVWCSSMPRAGPDAAAGLGQQQVWCSSSPGDTAGLLSPSLSLSLCLSPSPLAPPLSLAVSPSLSLAVSLSLSRSLALALPQSASASLPTSPVCGM